MIGRSKHFISYIKLHIPRRNHTYFFCAAADKVVLVKVIKIEVKVQGERRENGKRKSSIIITIMHIFSELLSKMHEMQNTFVKSLGI